MKSLRKISIITVDKNIIFMFFVFQSVFFSHYSQIIRKNEDTINHKFLEIEYDISYNGKLDTLYLKNMNYVSIQFVDPKNILFNLNDDQVKITQFTENIKNILKSIDIENVDTVDVINDYCNLELGEVLKNKRRIIFLNIINSFNLINWEINNSKLEIKNIHIYASNNYNEPIIQTCINLDNLTKNGIESFSHSNFNSIDFYNGCYTPIKIYIGFYEYDCNMLDKLKNNFSNIKSISFGSENIPLERKYSMYYEKPEYNMELKRWE